MKVDLNFDTEHLQKELQTRMNNHAKSSMIRQIESFFGTHKALGEGNKLITIYGDGFKEIDNFIAERFLDDKFKQEMNTYFEENWKRIFEDCMTKALQHKANAIAFAETKEV